MISSKPALGVLAAALLLAGCGNRAGSFDSSNDGGFTDRLGSLLAFNKTASPALPSKPAESVFCPEVIVLDGTASQRVYTGGRNGSSADLRYQYALGDTARDCSAADGQLTLKVGVEGQVLLGPAGAAGTFSVPVRVAVIRDRDQTPLVSKLYHVAATVPAGETGARFSLVSEPLVVPLVHQHSEDDYSIKLGIDEGGAGAEKAERKPRRR